MRLRPHSADSTMLRLWPTGSSVGVAPVDYDPVVLLILTAGKKQVSQSLIMADLSDESAQRFGR
jgi:hypothetical protein